MADLFFMPFKLIELQQIAPNPHWLQMTRYYGKAVSMATNDQIFEHPL